MSKLFGHGDLRLWLLKLLDERPRHGYEIISGVEEEFLGVYSPSPGTVYPRLGALEQEGFIEVVREEEGRKVYALTDKGREELASRDTELQELGQRLARSARDIARDVREDVKSSVRDLRREIKRAALEVRRDERRATRAGREASRDAREAAREAREVARSGRHAALAAKDAAREVGTEIKSLWRSLQADLDGFVSDVVSAARHHELDRTRLASLRDALRDARATVIEALERPEERK
jgi:DNA-binding PadR family transcriptional regulator